MAKPKPTDPPDAPALPPVRQPVEFWCAARRPAPWKHAVAAVLHAWAVGEELTEAEYVAAIDAASNLKLGY
jgi:hypothetical protein